VAAAALLGVPELSDFSCQIPPVAGRNVAPSSERPANSPRERDQDKQGERCLGLSWHAHAGCYVFENLEAGASIEDIMEWFDLTREQVTTVLDFAARSLEAPAHR
jgi:Protein of unknown function (DUF433)